MSDPTTQSAFILCPGQGAQHVGMGKAWAERCDVAKRAFAEADELLGLPLGKLCFEGPAEELNRTDIAQAAIYVASVACFRALREQRVIGGVRAAAGLSLGEFTALHVAGAFSFEDGLKLVRLRGQAMQEAATSGATSGGSMVAITGDVSEEQVNELCDKARGDGILVPANFNSPMQVVVSGSKDACERAVTVAAEMGFKPTPLAVAGAFHSPIMQPAADRLAAALDDVSWALPAVPVLSNVTGRPHDADIDTIKRRLVEQLTSPVRWSQSMAHAAAAPGSPGTRFVELAPGKVLAGLMRRIDRSAKVVNYAEPSDAREN